MTTIGFYKENFIDEASAAASVAATRAVKVGGVLGGVCAVCVAGEGGFKIAAGKKVTLTATESDDFEGVYNDSGMTSVRTFAAATSFNEGDVIAELPFASYSKDYAKVAFATDDTTVSGKVKVIPYVRG